MRHSPEHADDDHDVERLDERFRDLVVHLAPRVPLPPVAGIHRVVRRRRLRNRVLIGAASLVVLAGGATLVGVGSEGDGPPPRREAAAAQPPVSPVTTTAAALSDAFYPSAQEFPVVAGVYENWHVTETRQALTESLGPCATQTISGLGAVEAQERVFNHDRQGGGLVVLVRYPDERTAEAAAADFTGGMAGRCPTNQPNPAADGLPRIEALDRSGDAWRTQGVINGNLDQYVDFGIVRSGPVVAVVRETIIDPAKVPPADGFLRLVDSLRDRLGKNGSGP
ncbi:hypothetical protein [Embleya scabrispora]|uniref:hypothetical protein n=1 Tax=Embleya scabrispora TaxID=159449 RepID=UPI001319E8A7|nr:hypothetical protein [Embleya scabrispora]MYS83254.1 hypothetical protein [Streptomyces sp. SID5474]